MVVARTGRIPWVSVSSVCNLDFIVRISPVFIGGLLSTKANNVFLVDRFLWLILWKANRVERFFSNIGQWTLRFYS